MGGRPVAHEDPVMSKRAVSSLAWFLAGWVAYEIAWSITGIPRAVGPVVAAAVAAVVAVDPTGAFWGRPARIARTTAERQHFGPSPS
jgi:hypothetical protein